MLIVWKEVTQRVVPELLLPLYGESRQKSRRMVSIQFPSRQLPDATQGAVCDPAVQSLLVFFLVGSHLLCLGCTNAKTWQI